jgi:hypothetical protein
VDNLEQNLLAVIANTDPKVAYQKASEALDKVNIQRRSRACSRNCKRRTRKLLTS